jgi:hypothetical protein
VVQELTLLTQIHRVPLMLETVAKPEVLAVVVNRIPGRMTCKAAVAVVE